MANAQVKLICDCIVKYRAANVPSVEFRGVYFCIVGSCSAIHSCNVLFEYFHLKLLSNSVLLGSIDLN